MKIIATMAGTLVELKVKPGDRVVVGQEVAVLESMKMEVPLQSTHAGTVKEVLKASGDFINDGDTLVILS